MKNTIKSHWPITTFSTLSAIGGLAVPLVLVRTVSSSDMGNYKIFFLYLGLIPWLSLTAGIRNGLYHWASKQDFQKYFYSSWSLMVCASMLTLLISTFWGSGFGISFDGISVWWFPLGAFFTLLASFHEEALIASGNTWRGAIFSAMFELLRAIAVITVGLKTQNLDFIVATFVIALGVKAAFGIYFGRHLNLQKFATPFTEHSDITREVLRYAVPVSLSALLAIVTHYADQLTLSHMADAAYFAGYTLACLSLPPLDSFEQAVNRVLIPDLKKNTPHLLRDAVAELSWILIPATLGLIIFATPIVTLLFTDRYADTAIFLRLYALTYLLFSFPYDAWARAKGDAGWIFKNIAFAFLVAFAMIPALTHFYLGVGAVIGIILTQATLRIGGWFHVRKTTGWEIQEFIPIQELAYNAMIGLLLSAMSLVAMSFLGNGLRWFFICGPLYALLYLALTLRRRLSRRFLEREKPAVLQVTQYLEVGGLERVIYSICQSFKKSGAIDPFVFSYDERQGHQKYNPEFEKISVPVFSNVKGKGFSILTVFRIVKICHCHKIGTLHSHDLGPLIYASLAKIFTLGALKLVHTQHSFISLSEQKRNRIYHRFFSFWIDELTVVSEDTKQTYVSLGTKASQISVISNGALFPESVPHSVSEKIELRRQLMDHVESIWVLYLARINPKKGQIHALEAWSGIAPETRTKAKLVFVGYETEAGQIERLQRRARELNIFDQVVFAGLSKDPLPWLKACDLFLSLSEFEGMPLSPIEAYGSGLECVLSRISGHEILKDDSTEIDLPISTVGSARLEKTLSALARLTPEQIVVKRTERFAAVANFRTHYSVDTMANRYARLYAGFKINVETRTPS